MPQSGANALSRPASNREMPILVFLLLQTAPASLEEHRFGPPDPAWTEREERLREPISPPESPKAKDGLVRLRRDGLIPLEPDERSNAAWVERSWFDGKRIVRTRLHEPAGRLRLEIDWVGDEVFVRHVHPNGTTACYARTRDQHWIEGYSAAADGSGPRFLLAGKGELIVPEVRGDILVHLWFRREEVYLARESRQGRCLRVYLKAQGAHLDLHDKGEVLNMDDESWTWGPSEGPFYRLMRSYLTEDGLEVRKDISPKPDVRE